MPETFAPGTLVCHRTALAAPLPPPHHVTRFVILGPAPADKQSQIPGQSILALARVTYPHPDRHDFDAEYGRDTLAFECELAPWSQYADALAAQQRQSAPPALAEVISDLFARGTSSRSPTNSNGNGHAPAEPVPDQAVS